MEMKTYKHNRRIICYIKQNKDGSFSTCTGKPSDVGCISWRYSTLEEAERTAEEYKDNYIRRSWN